MLAVLAAIGVAFTLGVLSDRDPKTAVNALRPFSSYALYPILVAAADTPRRFKWVLASLFGTVIVGVGV